MKRWLLLIISLALSVSMATAALAEERNDSVPAEVMTSAEEALSLYQEYVMDRPKEYGFEDPEEANLLTLGQGHQVYSLNMNKLLQEDNAESLLALSDLSDEWEFIVLYEGEPRSFLSVGKNEQSNEWEALGFGGTSQYFAQKLNWFDEWTAGEREEENPYIIRNGSSRYIVANLQGNEYTLPVESLENAEEEAVPDREQLVASSEAIAELREGEGNQLAPLLLVVIGILILALTLRLAMRKQKKQNVEQAGGKTAAEVKQSPKQSVNQQAAQSKANQADPVSTSKKPSTGKRSGKKNSRRK